MTILAGADGKLYDIPQEKLEQYKVAPEEVEEKIKTSGVKPPAGIHPQQTRSQPTQMRLCLKR
jgi:hypothetical protein